MTYFATFLLAIFSCIPVVWLDLIPQVDSLKPAVIKPESWGDVISISALFFIFTYAIDRHIAACDIEVITAFMISMTLFKPTFSLLLAKYYKKPVFYGRAKMALYRWQRIGIYLAAWSVKNTTLLEYKGTTLISNSWQ